MKLPIAAVHEDPEVQLRDGLDMDRVEAMVEYEEQGGQLPPITVVGSDNLVGDGHHRLAAARRSGRVEIDANRIEGGMAEAIAAAIRGNDISSHMPLNRIQRNKGVKVLLRAGWTLDQVGKVAGVHGTTIGEIYSVMVARGELKAVNTASARTKRKPVAVLPEAARHLNDTTISRIVRGVPVDQQAAFATAVADAGISEPRVREAIKKVHQGMTPEAAVEDVTPAGRVVPVSFAEVAKQSRRRIERFTSEPMMVEGVERDFWQVLDVLASVSASIPLEAKSLARLLSEVAVKADYYATALRSAEEIEAMA